MWDNGGLLVSTQTSLSSSFDQKGKREASKRIHVHRMWAAHIAVFHWSLTTRPCGH